MKKIDINITTLSAQDYPIFIGKNILKQGSEFLTETFKNYRFACLIDSNVNLLYREKIDKFCKKLNAEKLLFPAGEENKTLAVAENLTQNLLEKNYGRKTLICNIGGGVVGDAGGFIAANFMRGVPFVQVPTSLLAMVDASVGGKVAVDVGGFKNSFGSFVSPVAIFTDIEFLKKLPKKEFESGLGECLKHGILGNEKLLKRIENPSGLERFVIENIQFKKAVVEKDFRENGIRTILNLGHTIGHAIESFFLNTENQVSHGEAVILGILAETKILESKNILTTKETEKIREIFKTHNLSVTLSAEIDPEKLWDFAHKDKKNKSGNVYISRIENIGDNLSNTKPYKVSITKNDFLHGLNAILKT